MIIAIEGIDGAGKSTQVFKLTRWLSREGIRCKSVKSLLFTSVGYKYYSHSIRNIQEVAPTTGGILKTSVIVLETHKYIWDSIVPLHEQGWTVICDRYTSSIRAYITAMALSTDLCEQFLGLVPKPDLGIFINLPFELAVERVEKSEGPLGMESRERLLRIYRALTADPGIKDYSVVDGQGSCASVFRDICSIVAPSLGLEQPSSSTDPFVAVTY